MAETIRRVRLITDAPLGEVRHSKGAEFTIVNKRPDQLEKGEVDERTGDAWLRFEWAVPIPVTVMAAKSGKSGDDAG